MRRTQSIIREVEILLSMASCFIVIESADDDDAAERTEETISPPSNAVHHGILLAQQETCRASVQWSRTSRTHCVGNAGMVGWHSRNYIRLICRFEAMTLTKNPKI